MIHDLAIILGYAVMVFGGAGVMALVAWISFEFIAYYTGVAVKIRKALLAYKPAPPSSEKGGG